MQLANYMDVFDESCGSFSPKNKDLHALETKAASCQPEILLERDTYSFGSGRKQRQAIDNNHIDSLFQKKELEPSTMMLRDSPRRPRQAPISSESTNSTLKNSQGSLTPHLS